MRKPKMGFRVIAMFALSIAIISIAQARATRASVCSIGDAANPSSRTAPSKTFAGAISKTAKGGEIYVLEQHCFGAITTTKNMLFESINMIASVHASETSSVNCAADVGGSNTQFDLTGALSKHKKIFSPPTLIVASTQSLSISSKSYFGLA